MMSSVSRMLYSVATSSKNSTCISVSTAYNNVYVVPKLLIDGAVYAAVYSCVSFLLLI